MKILNIEQGTVPASFWIEEQMKKMYLELYGDKNFTIITTKVGKQKYA